MSVRSRQGLIQRKRRQLFADVTNLAQNNPDALARNLLHTPKYLKVGRQRSEIWDLFQQLGGDAVIRRATDAILHARSFSELKAVLHAAAADGWFETGPAIAHRFHREAQRLMNAVGDADSVDRIETLVSAAAAVRAPLGSDDIRILLKHSLQRLREIGASAVLDLRRKEMVSDCLPLCWESGLARVPAADALGLLGESDHAAELWSRALSARRSHRQRVLHYLLAPLGRMGAFDIQVGVREWIIEDATVSAASVWAYAEVWSHLIAAKFAAGACDRSEAIGDLRWFLSAAGVGRGSGVPKIPDAANAHGYLYIARELSRLGASAESEALLARFAAQGLPDVDHFPDLLFPGLRGYVPDDSNTGSLIWLAAMGNPQSQERLLELWFAAFSAGCTPDHWSIHAWLEPASVVAVLRRALRNKAPGVLRHLLSLPMTDAVAAGVHPQVERLAKSHPSAVVRWKAKRVLRTLPRNADAGHVTGPGVRWVRLDAAILSGAARSDQRKKTSRSADALPAGLLPPLRAGLGYRLEMAGINAAGRVAILCALKRGPLNRALDRQLPSGPALEDRPDIRAVRELAPPGNEIDQHMAELAEAVMHYWGDGDDLLTLNEEGVGLVATALSADAAALDEDDLEACGAFIGEALRKTLGGNWSGYDGHYFLETGNETLDPHGWISEICSRTDICDRAEWLATKYIEAVVRLAPEKKKVCHPDPGNACERILNELCAMPASTPMTELLSATRSLSYRLDIEHWPAVLLSLDPLLGNPVANRVLASVLIYAQPEIVGRIWSRWGRARREESGIIDALVEAMAAAAERDDLEAMPCWTDQPLQSRCSYINTLRKRMDAKAWQKVLLLLLRQRAAAGNREGVAWCLFSYRYEFADCLPLLAGFLGMSVSARQTVLRATLHCTRSEIKLHRPLWCEALRDPSSAVVRAAIDAAATHRTRSMRHLVAALTHDKRAEVAQAATRLLSVWKG